MQMMSRNVLLNMELEEDDDEDGDIDALAWLNTDMESMKSEIQEIGGLVKARPLRQGQVRNSGVMPLLGFRLPSVRPMGATHIHSIQKDIPQQTPALVSLLLSSFPPVLEFSFQSDLEFVFSVSTWVSLVSCPQQCLPT
ncbi:hypothetical protein STEG23_013335, partial [Scotinomys teguina]